MPKSPTVTKQSKVEANKAKQALWEGLSQAPLSRWRFRRSIPIRGYIADFVCLRARLIVELSSASVDSKAEDAYDQIRASALEAEGFAILRFTHSDVFSTIEGVLTDIERALEASETRKPTN